MEAEKKVYEIISEGAAGVEEALNSGKAGQEFEILRSHMNAVVSKIGCVGPSGSANKVPINSVAKRNAEIDGGTHKDFLKVSLGELKGEIKDTKKEQRIFNIKLPNGIELEFWQ